MLVNLTNCKTWDKSSTHSTPIIIVTYNREEALRKCLLSLYNTTDHPIHIIDNSCGSIDSTLEWAKTLSNKIHINKNDQNIGKAASIQKHRDIIGKSQWFISMDPDVIVKKNDINTLIKSANCLLEKSYPISLLAPTLNSGDNSFKKQIETGVLDMHKIGSIFHLENGLYINEYLAGCLLLINRVFFDEIGGFKQQRIYGGDDGELSKLTLQNNMISVLNTNVECQHYRLDETEEYITWKKNNVRGPTNQQNPLDH